MTLMRPTKLPAGTRGFTRAEYYQMAEVGIFEGERVELIKGEILRMSPQNNPHASAVSLINRWLVRSLTDAYTVRCQSPLVTSDITELEPDFAVVAGNAEAMTEHPRTALLVIEVSDSSLRHDRRKASAYASVGVLEYWILNLPKRQLEVYHQPMADEDAEFGWRYADVATLDDTHRVKPAGLPIGEIQISALLPRG